MRTWLCSAFVFMSAFAFGGDREELLNGVKTIAAPGIPGVVSTFGPNAEPLIAGKASEVQGAVVAYARLGKGRIVAFSHDGYFGGGALSEADTGKLMRNAARWLGSGTAGDVLTVNLPDLAAYLRGGGHSVREVAVNANLAGAGVVAMVHEPLTPERQTRLRQFVREGGGLLLASTGWGWQMITGKTMPEHPLNAICEPAGLIWTDGMADRTTRAGFDALTSIHPDLHAGRALANLGANATPQALASVLAAGLNLSDREPAFGAKLRALRAQVQDAAPPAAKDPVTLKSPQRRLALALDTVDAQRAPVDKVRAHPAAAEFPGAVPAAAPRTPRTVVIDRIKPGWASLGLYAAPGEIVTVKVPQDWAAKGLRVQIGAHTDELWGLDRWRRAPAIVRSFAVTGPETKAASAFGGLIYIVFPAQAAGPIQVEVRGAVEAPLFVLGRTSLAEWKNQQRSRPGPWAELATDKLILTVPSADIRNLEDPETLMKFWDRVLDACADLAAWPRERERPERIVADEQISAGYMHSGYPIMTHLDAAPLAVDLRRLTTEGSWGHFHELGHNHQSGDWTFDGTTEVTVNLFSTYIYTHVLGVGLGDGHPAIKNRDEWMSRVQRHLAAGAPFETWKNDPFLALSMYLQVIEAFGWDPVKRAIQEYHGLPGRERPRTDDAKRDQWMTRLSRAVGRDLSGFFQKWGVPTSAQARKSLSDLPAWMPKEFGG